MAVVPLVLTPVRGRSVRRTAAAFRFATDAFADDLAGPAALREALLGGFDAVEVRNAGREIAPGTAGAQGGEDGVEDATQWVGARSAVSWQGREIVLQALPLRASFDSSSRHILLPTISLLGLGTLVR